MKIAFISDVHGNHRAWRAVMKRCSAIGVSDIICLGDFVGYGPKPKDVTLGIRANASGFVMGNHDAAAVGILDPSIFNDHAKLMVEWTARHLDEDVMTFLKELPYAIEVDCVNFSALCVHGSLPEPEEFDYIIEEDEARSMWDECTNQVCFVGHTHEPRVDILSLDGSYDVLECDSISIEDDKRYIVNVGSVGLSRTDEIVACFCTYDTETNLVEWQKVDFDIEALKTDIKEIMRGTGLAELATALFTHDESFDVDAMMFPKTRKAFKVKRRPDTEKLTQYRRTVPQARKQKKSKAPLIIFGVILLVVAAALIVAFVKGNQ